MASLKWKLATFASLGTAAFLAVHPMRSGSEKGGGTAETSKGHASSSPGGFLGGWLGGGQAQAAVSDGPTGKLVGQLRAAKTPTAACQAITSLGYAGDEEATAAVSAEAMEKTRRPEVRGCAVDALGKMKTGAARSWLGELISDRDPAIRDKALMSLAQRDDSEAHGMVLDAAHSDDPAVRKSALLALGNARILQGTPLLLQALETADMDTRAQLVAALGASGDPAAVSTLSRLVRESGAQIRGAALVALGQIGGEASANVLGDVLLEGRRGDVDEAAAALAQMNEPAGRRLLIAAAESDLHNVRIAALGALTELEGKDVHELMLAKFTSGDREVASVAARYFGARHDDSAVPALAEMVRHGTRESATQAISALVMVGGEAARAALLEAASKSGSMQDYALTQLAGMPGGREDARKLSLALVRDEAGQSANVAINILAEDGTAESRDVLVSLSRTTGGSASQAIGALARRGDAESMKALADVAEHGTNKELRMEAMGMIAQAGAPGAADMLSRAMKDGDPQTQRNAMQGFATLGGPEAEKALLDGASSNDRQMRITAVRSLAQLSSPSSNAALAKLAADPDANVARTALFSMARSDPERAGQIAEQQIKSPEKTVRRSAMQLSHMLEPDSARAVLVAGLADSESDIAESAARMLGQMGGAEAQIALGDVLSRDSASADTRRAAADALEQMGGSAVKRYGALIDKYKTREDPQGERGWRGAGDDESEHEN